MFIVSTNFLIDLGCMCCKVVDSRYKNYAIFISQTNLSLYRPISKTDYCQAIFVFLFRLKAMASNFCDDFNIVDEIVSGLKYVFSLYL